MVQFHLLGFPVTVQPWHWAILAFCGGALGIRDPEDLLPVLLFMPAGFVSILIHELGHALTMRQFGCLRSRQREVMKLKRVRAKGSET